MSRFAEIKEGIVQRVIVADSKEWCEKQLGGEWVETIKYSTDKNYAGKGDTYNKEVDNFISPQPFPSWVLDEQLKWRCPCEYPKDGKYYVWDESQLGYAEVLPADGSLLKVQPAGQIKTQLAASLSKKNLGEI